LYFIATSGVCLIVIRSGTVVVFKRNYNRKKKRLITVTTRTARHV
jgi:hypothetical protein